MMDLCEATKTLNSYSEVIDGQTSYLEKITNDKSIEAQKVRVATLPLLEAKLKEALIIMTLVVEEVTKNSQRFIVGFIDELTRLMEALNRVESSIVRARASIKLHEAHLPRPVTETPSAKMIKEFWESQYRTKTRNGMN